MVLKALRPIKSGQEICDNYGPTFYKKSRYWTPKRISLHITYKKDWGSGLLGITFSDLSVAEGEKLATSLHSFYATYRVSTQCTR